MKALKLLQQYPTLFKLLIWMQMTNAKFCCNVSHICWTWRLNVGQNEAVGKNEHQRRSKRFCWLCSINFEWSIFWASWIWFWILNVCSQKWLEAPLALNVFAFPHRNFSQKQKAFKLQYYILSSYKNSKALVKNSSKLFWMKKSYTFGRHISLKNHFPSNKLVLAGKLFSSFAFNDFKVARYQQRIFNSHQNNLAWNIVKISSVFILSGKGRGKNLLFQSMESQL